MSELCVHISDIEQPSARVLENVGRWRRNLFLTGPKNAGRSAFQPAPAGGNIIRRG